MKNSKIHIHDSNPGPLQQLYCKYFEIGPPKPDTYSPHKAVDVKIPVEGTNQTKPVKVSGKN
jgi:hypothetical protein